MKSYHRWQSIGYYVFDTALLSNQINANTEIAGFVRGSSSHSLIPTFSKMAKAFPPFDVVHYNGSHITKWTIRCQMCAPSVSEETDRAAYESVGGVD